MLKGGFIRLFLWVQSQTIRLLSRPSPARARAPARNRNRHLRVRYHARLICSLRPRSGGTLYFGGKTRGDGIEEGAAPFVAGP